MKNKPKIFVDAHCFDGIYQGSRTFLKGLYSSFPADKADIFLGARDTARLRREFPAIPSERFIRYTHDSTLIRLLWEIPVLIDQYHIDYAHFQYVAPLCKRCAYIVTTHDLLFKDFKQAFPLYYRLLRGPVFRYSLKHAEVKTTPSRYSRERMIFHYGLPRDSIQIIPNGVDECFFSAAGATSVASNDLKRRFGLGSFILCVSRIEPRKNQELLLRTYLELELYKQGLSLVFIGEDALRAGRFRRLLSRLDPAIRPFVLHLRQVSGQDMMAFYRAARIMVYPSLAEGFGIPPLEAAAMKTPVLCAYGTALAELGFPDKYLFDPAAENSLREKMAALLEKLPSEEYLEDIALKIREKYRWRYAADMLAKCLEARTSVPEPG